MSDIAVVSKSHRRRRVRRSVKPVATNIRRYKSMDLVQQLAIPLLESIDTDAAASYVEDFAVYLTNQTGYDLLMDHSAIELTLTDLLAIVAPAIEFALSKKGKDISLEELELFVLALLKIVVDRVNAHTKVKLIFDDKMIADLSVTLRNLWYAYQKQWDKIDEDEQVLTGIRIFSRCMPGCNRLFKPRPPPPVLAPQ